MIPDHNQSGVIPPFIPGTNPAAVAAISPYEISMVDIVQRFGLNARRRSLLSGLLDYRTQLRTLGFNFGFQWIDGSFVEDVENTQGREPNDIDLITFAVRPENIPDLRLMAMNKPDLFDPAQTKAKYGCDAYFVDLGLSTLAIHDYTVYWLTLFSHQRATNLWKGMLKVPLQSDDDAARSLLQA